MAASPVPSRGYMRLRHSVRGRSSALKATHLEVAIRANAGAMVIRPDLQRQGALDAEHVSGPTRPDLRPDDPGRGRARRGCGSARGRLAGPADLTSYAEPTREAHR